MFTGIVEELGTVNNLVIGHKSAKLTITADRILQDVRIGDSIAVNGVCLTVTSFSKNGFCCDVMPETVNKTVLKTLIAGSRVNLERALRLDSRLGGHLVTGHVDGTGLISAKQPFDNAVLITISAEEDLLRYIIKKGSVAIDGISLTVVDCGDTWFSVSIIPHTLAVTTLNFKTIGDKVNLETDMIGKYVERMLGISQHSAVKHETRLDKDFLFTHGFLD